MRSEATMYQLFMDIADTFDTEEGKSAATFLKHVKELPKDATEIY